MFADIEFSHAVCVCFGFNPSFTLNLALGDEGWAKRIGMTAQLE